MTNPTTPDSPRDLRPAYQAPRIVTWSAKDLEKRVPHVTACESFDVSGTSVEDRLNPAAPLTPGSY